MGFARRQLLDVQKLLEYRKHLVYDFSTCAGACTYSEKIKLAKAFVKVFAAQSFVST